MKFPFRLEKAPPPSTLRRALLPVRALVATFLAGAIPILAAGANPLTAYYQMAAGSLGDMIAITEVFVRAAPLMLTGLAIAIAFRAKFWNIGAEGQLYAGAILGTLVAVNFPELPFWIHIPFMIVAGMIGGALCALPGILKIKLKVGDVVITLMLNFIMIILTSYLVQNVLKDPFTRWPQSPPITDSATYPILIPFTRFHLGIVIALFVALVVGYGLIEYTALGYEIKAVGSNEIASRLAGINPTALTIKTAIISGSFAGLAGIGEVAGIRHHLIATLSPVPIGYGLTGVVIAVISGLNPLSVVLVAFLFSIIINGSQTMSRLTGVPIFLSEIFQGLALGFSLLFIFLDQYRIRRVR
jgi:simple sugar transport system permease protein